MVLRQSLKIFAGRTAILLVCHEVVQMVLRQSLQNKYSYVYKKTTFMQKKKKNNFTCNQNKMAKTHSRSNRIIHGHIYVIHKK